MLTLGLAMSTRLSGMVGGVIALVLFGMACIAGIVSNVGQAFDNGTLIRVGTIAKLVLPTDGLWRGAIHALEPVLVVTAARAVSGPVTASDPFFEPQAPPIAFDLWAAAWIVAVLAAAVASFRAREV